MKAPIIFSGEIPRNYEDYLTPFLFDPFADDLVQRISTTDITNVLELACGTGCVTKRLVEILPATAHLTATDLQTDMLAVAQQNIEGTNVNWTAVDMTNIPYENEQFDLVICQFGIMLVPDKYKAITEIFRVLRKGGKLVFNVWGNIAENDIWNIGNEVLNLFLDIHPILQNPGPFSMTETETIEWLQQAGFADTKAVTVNKTGTIATAVMAAKGFILGLPVVMAISKKDPELIPQIQETLEMALAKQLGKQPMQSRLQALIFEATK